MTPRDDLDRELSIWLEDAGPATVASQPGGGRGADAAHAAAAGLGQPRKVAPHGCYRTPRDVPAPADGLAPAHHAARPSHRGRRPARRLATAQRDRSHAERWRGPRLAFDCPGRRHLHDPRRRDRSCASSPVVPRWTGRRSGRRTGPASPSAARRGRDHGRGHGRGRRRRAAPLHRPSSRHLRRLRAARAGLVARWRLACLHA